MLPLLYHHRKNPKLCPPISPPNRKIVSFLFKLIDYHSSKQPTRLPGVCHHLCTFAIRTISSKKAWKMLHIPPVVVVILIEPLFSGIDFRNRLRQWRRRHYEHYEGRAKKVSKSACTCASPGSQWRRRINSRSGPMVLLRDRLFQGCPSCRYTLLILPNWRKNAAIQHNWNGCCKN